MVHDVELVQEADVAIGNVTDEEIGLIREKGIGTRPLLLAAGHSLALETIDDGHDETDTPVDEDLVSRGYALERTARDRVLGTLQHRKPQGTRREYRHVFKPTEMGG